MKNDFLTLFAYGTLQVPEVLDRLLGNGAAHEVLGSKAVIKGHQARYVKGEDFPIVIEAANGLLVGTLLQLNPRQQEVINFYEGHEDYDLRTIEAFCEGTNKPLGEVYLYWPKPHLIADEHLWSLSEWYQKVELAQYLKKVDQWMIDFK
jgi:gamma-glutamylcyclotransferase (GGCT)/AIG2-like uncharacterized protein YtfP